MPVGFRFFIVPVLCVSAGLLTVCPDSRGEENRRWQVTPSVNALDGFNVTPDSPALAKADPDKPGWAEYCPERKFELKVLLEFMADN